MGVDLVCLIRDASVSTGSGDKFVLELIQRSQKPALLLLNKTDNSDKTALLPLLEWYKNQYRLARAYSISALRGNVNDVVPKEMINICRKVSAVWGMTSLTDHQCARWWPRSCRDDPANYPGRNSLCDGGGGEKWDEEREDFTRIHCAIFVERTSQKKIVMGKARSLERNRHPRRQEIEHLLGHRCHWSFSLSGRRLAE